MSKTIDLTPSPQEYARMLALLARDGTLPADRQWALDELVRIIGELDTKLTEARQLGLYWQAEAELAQEDSDG